ncbi:hypothetical protein EVJ32_04895 [Exiguobacterium sp. SH5S4]|uniref:hypothetical protein n=1 Tax=Exiguobacterium sp. SH5S4 TaxID=2510961 RepID=UPI00103CE73F|nr:hypothetical protein [Exiguobacterium sp. SH5S4]TCI26714.1 hypothetical protein EVJ32_04895 [Exiguobacterium sp. SH5S4]
MSLEAEVIEAVRKRLEEEMEKAEAAFNSAIFEHDEHYESGRGAAYDFALQIIKTEMGRRGLK